MDAARGDVEAACPVSPASQQAGDGLDAGADTILGGQRAAGQPGAGESGLERGDMLWLVGATVPRGDAILARQVYESGQDDRIDVLPALSGG